MNQLSELQSKAVALTAELDARESRIRALREREERFRALFTSSNDDVIARALDASRGKIYGTDGAAAKLGIKATTLASRLKKLGLGRASPSE